jgi:hypothetical protein
MARGKADRSADHNNAILEYALQHLEREREEIQAKIEHIVKQLGRKPATAATAKTAGPATSDASAPRKTRVLSEAARKRIAAAQKRRWAEHRKAKAGAE